MTKKKKLSALPNTTTVVISKKVAVAPKDKRTKAELIKLLEHTQSNFDRLMQRQINIPAVIAPDSIQYKNGYSDGFNAANAKDEVPWWVFWK